MKIKGTKIHREQVEVEVSGWMLLETLCQNVREKIIPQNIKGHDSIYISLEGNWEGWDNSHGSGITHTYSKATELEKDQWEAINKFHKIASTTLQGEK